VRGTWCVSVHVRACVEGWASWAVLQLRMDVVCKRTSPSPGPVSRPFAGALRGLPAPRAQAAPHVACLGPSLQPLRQHARRATKGHTRRSQGRRHAPGTCLRYRSWKMCVGPGVCLYMCGHVWMAGHRGLCFSCGWMWLVCAGLAEHGALVLGGPHLSAVCVHVLWFMSQLSKLAPSHGPTRVLNRDHVFLMQRLPSGRLTDGWR
jgi:hypothetical protein